VQEIVKIGTSSGHFVELTTEIYYTTATFNDCVEKLKHWAQTRAFTASEARDYLGTTRKYIIPLLEKMDEKGITGRRDDRRVFKNAD
jgi:selenocysteine-specific elongation factor